MTNLAEPSHSGAMSPRVKGHKIASKTEYSVGRKSRRRTGDRHRAGCRAFGTQRFIY